jgi:aminopeptidase-like protein
MRVFRCRATNIDDDDRIDGNMRKILRLVDGYKGLASIAFASGMSMTEFQKSVKALIDLNLILPADAEETLVE